MRKVLVIGDTFLDCHIMGSSDRLSPEAPVPVVNVNPSCSRWSLGGAGNVAANLASLGASVTLASASCLDMAGRKQQSMFTQAHIRYLSIGLAPRTTTKSRLFAGTHQVARIDDEPKRPLGLDPSVVFQKLKPAIERSDAVVISDYGKGVLSRKLAELVIGKTLKHNIPLFVDPKPHSMGWYKGATLITPNLKEAREYMSMERLSMVGSPEMVGNRLSEELGGTDVLLTLGKDGLLYIGQGIIHSPSQAKEVYDVSGAGDVVLAVITDSYLKGDAIEACMDRANKAASVAVSKIGTYVVKPEDL